MDETARQRAAKRLAHLKNERSTWEPDYRKLAEMFLPRKSRWLLDAGEANRGHSRHNKVIDGTPIFAARTLSSGMLAGNSSPSRPWIRFVTEDDSLMESAKVREWLEIVQKDITAVFARSNFYNVLPAVYGEAGVFGTAPMLIEDDPKSAIRCRSYTCGSYYLANGADGRVNTFYCEYKMTVRQLVEKFGFAKLQPATQGLYKSGAFDQWIDVVHLIEPNKDRQYGRADSQNMPWRSCYYENGTGETFLRESGYEEFPIMAPRWSITGEDVYGSSPAMDALGDARQLQFTQKSKAHVVDKIADPPMVADPEFFNKPASLLPGSVTYSGFTAGGSAPKFQPAYVPHPTAVTVLREEAAEIQQRINVALYVDLFLMVAMSDRRQVTAEEIAKKYEEKVLMLDPVLTQHHNELLAPAIDRVYALRARAGAYPEPPEELAGEVVKPDFIGILAQAQRMVATSGIERIVTFASSLAKGQVEAGESPTVLDKIDFDQAIDEYNNAIGAPAKIVRGDDDVAERRAARAEAAQQQQMAQAAGPLKDAASAAQTLSETQVGGASVLDRMAGAA